MVIRVPERFCKGLRNFKDSSRGCSTFWEGGREGEGGGGREERERGREGEREGGREKVEGGREGGKEGKGRGREGGRR